MLVGVTGFMHPEVVGNAVRHPETALGTGSIILRMAEEAPPRQEAPGTR